MLERSNCFRFMVDIWHQKGTYPRIHLHRSESRWRPKGGLVRSYDKPIHWSCAIYFPRWYRCFFCCLSKVEFSKPHQNYQNYIKLHNICMGGFLQIQSQNSVSITCGPTKSWLPSTEDVAVDSWHQEFMEWATEDNQVPAPAVITNNRKGVEIDFFQSFFVVKVEGELVVRDKFRRFLNWS